MHVCVYVYPYLSICVHVVCIYMCECMCVCMYYLSVCVYVVCICMCESICPSVHPFSDRASLCASGWPHIHCDTSASRAHLTYVYYLAWTLNTILMNDRPPGFKIKHKFSIFYRKKMAFWKLFWVLVLKGIKITGNKAFLKFRQKKISISF